jgi:flagellar hook-associated protein 1
MLAAGLQHAKDGLADTSRRLQATAANIANASSSTASRKVVSDGSFNHPTTAAQLTRAGSDHLRTALWEAQSAQEGARVSQRLIGEIQSVFGALDGSTGLIAHTDALINGMRSYATAPHQNERASPVVASAKAIVADIARGIVIIDRVNATIDQELKRSVDHVNVHLEQLAVLDARVALGSATASDISDVLDQRDATISQLSNLLDIQVVRGSNDRVSIFLSSGTTLFERTARSVTTDNDGLSGHRSIVIDDVVLLRASKRGTGRVDALLQFRDNVVAPLEARLDAISSLLVQAFAEQDLSAAAGPDRPGLFVDVANPIGWTAASSHAGLARRIGISPAYDPTNGGRASLLRDAGSAGPAYAANPGGYPGFVDRLETLIDRLHRQQPSSTQTFAGPDASVEGFSRESVSWLATQSADVSDRVDRTSAVVARSTTALSQDAGVQLDEELTVMLSLERAFQANGRLIATFDELYKSLLAMAA